MIRWAMLRRALALALGLALGLATAPAGANGRFPQAQQLVQAPSDPSRLVLRATYGLLVSSDAGGSWHWICEQSIGYSGVEDPAVGITAGGTLLAGIFDGLRVSSDGGCDFSSGGAELEGRFVVDLSVDKVTPSRALALTSNGKGGGSFDTRLWESTDDGKTFTQIGTLPDTLLGLTLDPAPSEPSRIYVSGLGGSAAPTLQRSIDGGKTWVERPIAGLAAGAAPFLAAIDPKNADRVWLRATDSDTGRLLVSDDAGDSWTEVLAKPGYMLGFALSPDGATVSVGFGDPKGGAAIDPDSLGLWRAPTSSHAFERVFTGPVNCLTWTAAGLFACSSQFDQGFELGLASDPMFASGTKDPFTPLLTLTGLTGPLACSTGSSAQCAAAWPATCELIGKCDGPDGGVGGAAGSGGGGASGDGGDGGGCGCRVAGGPAGASAGLAALLLLLALWRRQRR